MLRIFKIRHLCRENWFIRDGCTLLCTKITGTNIQKETLFGKYRGTTFSKQDMTLIAKVLSRDSRLEESVFSRRIDAVSTKINGWLGIETLVAGIHRRFADMTSFLATLRRRVPTPYTGRSCRFCPTAWQTKFMVSCRSPIRALVWRLIVARVFLFGWQWCLEFCRRAWTTHWYSSTISYHTTGRTMWQYMTFRTGHPDPHVTLHIITDSPSPQYRNRSILGVMAHFPAVWYHSLLDMVGGRPCEGALRRCRRCHKEDGRQSGQGRTNNL